MSFEPAATQASRRNKTRDALIDATVESLLKHGLAGTTTRAIADACGVSQGALQYHFATKAELVDAALSEELVSTLAEILEPAPAENADSLDRALELVDQLWEFHRLPIFAAVFELLAIAHRDSATARKTAQTLSLLLDQISDAARRRLPVDAGAPDFPARLSAVVSAVRGAAAIGTIPTADAGKKSWPQLRVVLARVLLGTADPKKLDSRR